MLLIKNGTLIDGTGAKARRTDILVSGNHISAIGNFQKKKGWDFIDALGMYIMPGFIDVSGTADHDLTLLTNPAQEEKVRQGITTMIYGSEGASLAPLIYGSLAHLRKWSELEGVNIGWNSMRELFAHLERKKNGTNIGILVGYNTIRRDMLGEEMRDPTEGELQVMGGLITKSLKDGALGISLDLASAHGSQIAITEIAMIQKIAETQNAMISTTLRATTNCETAIKELRHIAKRSNSTIILVNALEHRTTKNDILQKLEAMSDAKNIYYTIDTEGKTIIPLYRLLPLWLRRGNLEHMLRTLHVPEEYTMVREHLNNNQALPDAEIIWAKEHDILKGKTIKELSTVWEMPIAETAILLMQRTKLRATITHNIIEGHELKAALLAPQSIPIGKLGAWAIGLCKENNAERETMIKKITATPASIMKLQKRGVVSEGNIADLILIEKEEITKTILDGSVVYEQENPKIKTQGTVIKNT